MAAYVVADVLDVNDEAGFAEYRELVPPTIAAYGGRYVTRGGAVETVEGDWSPKRLVILEFDSVEKAKEWYSSDEYKTPKDVRHKSAKSNLIIIPGV